MPTSITFIRHAMPTIDPTAPPPTWHLSPEGRTAAAHLGPRLPPPPHYLAASTEPKAVDTLTNATHDNAPIHTDPRFNEVHRPHDYPDGIRPLVAAYLTGTAHPDWEPHHHATTRFDTAVRHHLDRAADRPLIIATHGTILTLWLHHTTGLDDPAAYQRALAFPDVVTVAPPESWHRRPPAAT